MSSVDLFSLATSGVNASGKLLQTTSNNIANVNTPGYVRERTELETQSELLMSLRKISYAEILLR